MSDIKIDRNGQPTRYLGDGVTATFDGHHIWLDLSVQGGEERIALEPVVFNRLVSFRQFCARDSLVRTQRELDADRG